MRLISIIYGITSKRLHFVTISSFDCGLLKGLNSLKLNNLNNHIFLIEINLIIVLLYLKFE